MSPIYEEQYSPVKDALSDKATLFSRSDIDINTIYYEISGICNAKCTYCPTGSGVTKGRPARFIPPEEFSRGLDRLYELGLLNNDVFFGLFNWGDPLLHPQLNEILHILKESDQSFALSTNGSFIPKNLNSSSLDNLSYIRLSLPGFSQKSYDKIHRLDFEKVLQNIGILNELVPPNTLEVLLYAYKFNIEEISRASEYFNDKNIQFRVGMPHLMDYEDAVGYLTETIDPVKKQGIEDDLFTDHIKSLLLYKEDKKSCPYLQNQLVIDEYNNVLTCCVLSKNSEYYTVGSLFELTKDEIFDVKTRGRSICLQCMSAGVPYWYEFNCRHLLQELQAFNTQTYCYIDTGYGFSEKQKVSSNVNSRALRAPFHAFFDLRGFNDIKALRWDPVEGRLCHISIDKIQVEMKNGDVRLVEPEDLTTNGERISDDEFRFNTIDPWIGIPAEGQINNVVITGSWLVKDIEETIPHLDRKIIQSNVKVRSLQQTIKEHDAQVALLDERVEQLTAETQSLQITIADRDAQIASLNEQTRKQATQLMQLSNELASMKQSVVWRLTTMFHTKVIEKLLPLSSKHRGTYDLFLKGSRVLVNDGWNSFWMSVKEYRGSRKGTNNEYSQWIIENEPSAAELAQQRNDSQTFQYLPCISIITPVYNISPEILKSTLQSVIDQTYGNWELCLVDGNSENPEVKDLLKRYADDDPRILVTFLDENYGISGNSNAALSMATGEFILFLDHDDMLAPFALFEIVNALNENPFLDVIYSDRDLLSEDGVSRYNPLFKPDWSPEIMLSANYLAHLCVIRREILDTVGQFNSDLDGAQDWDLYLRVAEKTDKIYHIPKVLYHWRSVQTSCAERGEKAKPYIVNAQQTVIQRHLERYNLPGQVTMHQPSGWHIQWDLPLDKLISIIIPSKNVSLLKNCLESIFSLTTYQNYEIIVIDTGLDAAVEPEFIEKISYLKNVKIVEYKDPFNYSAANNIGRLHAKGELLLFLNDDTLVISPDWLSEMAGWSILDKIGVVGAKLLFPNGTIQHAGVILGLTGFAGHPFAGSAKHTMGMFGSTDWYRNYCAVTGACMMVRREIFDEVGGFDESFILCGSDVEFCLRVHMKGYRIMYNPFATLKHLESVSRGSDIPESDFQLSCLHYTPVLESGDPYFNSNLSYWNCIPTLQKSGEKRPIDFVREVVKE